jgi:chromate transporter
MVFLLLFWEFAKIGTFAIGGGMVTLPFLYGLAETRGWFTADMVTSMIALSESTPGPIGIKMAAYAGFAAGSEQLGWAGGLLGGVIAPFALILPAFVLIIALFKLLLKYYKHPMVESVFGTLRPAATGLIAYAGFLIMLSSMIYRPGFAGAWAIPFALWFDFKAWLLFGALLFGMLKWKKHPVLYLGIGAAAGVLLKL